MEEKSKKELRKERREARRTKRRKFLSENKEIVAQVGIGVLSFIASIGGIIAIFVDHDKTKEEQNFERAFIHDNLNDVYWYLDEPLTNDEVKETIKRRNDGEDLMDILEDMGKI